MIYNTTNRWIKYHEWHEAESNPELLELWVADMDFLPVPEIRDAVINYAETHILVILIQVKSFISPSLIGKKSTRLRR